MTIAPRLHTDEKKTTTNEQKYAAESKISAFGAIVRNDLFPYEAMTLLSQGHWNGRSWVQTRLGLAVPQKLLLEWLFQYNVAGPTHYGS